jgi:hypothetical protein
MKANKKSFLVKSFEPCMVRLTLKFALILVSLWLLYFILLSIYKGISIAAAAQSTVNPHDIISFIVIPSITYFGGMLNFNLNNILKKQRDFDKSDEPEKSEI